MYKDTMAFPFCCVNS